MIPNDNYIAFFDIDGTLIPADSGSMLVKRAFGTGMMSRKNFVHALYLSLMYKFHLRDPERIIHSMAVWVKGHTEESLIELSEEVFRESLSDTIYPEVIAEIRYHKERNARVVILSSAIQTISSLFARHLNLDDVICSRLEVRDGIFTGRPSGRFCFGKEKAVRLRDYCKKMKAVPEKAWYYGDNISDFHALHAVGHPVCINPDKKLAKIALKKHWVVHVWK